MTSADSDAEFIYKITQQNNLLMNFVTAFSKSESAYKVTGNIQKKDIKLKQLHLTLKKITKTAETGR